LFVDIKMHLKYIFNRFETTTEVLMSGGFRLIPIPGGVLVIPQKAESRPEEHVQHSDEQTTCPKCGKKVRIYWKVIGDPPELCAQDHRPPSWGRFTACCHRRVGEPFYGYSPPRSSKASS